MRQGCLRCKSGPSARARRDPCALAQSERSQGGGSDTEEQYRVAPAAHCGPDQKWSCHQRLSRFSVGEAPFRYARHYRVEGMRSYPRSSVVLGNTIPKSLGIVGHAPGLTLILESRADPSSGEMTADARSATRDLEIRTDTRRDDPPGSRRQGDPLRGVSCCGIPGDGRLEDKTSIEDPRSGGLGMGLHVIELRQRPWPW